MGFEELSERSRTVEVVVMSILCLLYLFWKCVILKHNNQCNKVTPKESYAGSSLVFALMGSPGAS